MKRRRASSSHEPLVTHQKTFGTRGGSLEGHLELRRDRKQDAELREAAAGDLAAVRQADANGDLIAIDMMKGETAHHVGAEGIFAFGVASLECLDERGGGA